MLNRLVAVIILFCSFVPLAAYASTDGKKACRAGIVKSGFEPEEPYEFLEPGFFSREKHIFGVFTCELQSDGTVHKILRGDSTIAEDGYFGVNTLQIRDRIASRASKSRMNAESRKDREIQAARNNFERISKDLSNAEESALAAIRQGLLRAGELKKLGFDTDELANLSRMLGVNPPPQQSHKSTDSSDQKVEDKSLDEADRLQKSAKEAERLRLETEAAELERERERLRSELPRVFSLAEEGNFRGAEKIIRRALELEAWSADDLSDLEERVIKSVRPIPSSDTISNKEGYQLLTLLAPNNVNYDSSYKKYKEQQIKETADQKRRAQEEAEASRRKAEAQALREAKDRFKWVASRLNSNNSEAQREYAFEQVDGKLVVGTGRVSDVERGGLLIPPTVTLEAGYRGLDVYCRLPRSISDAALARISKGEKYECVGKASSYTFIFGSAGMSIDAKSID